jgi:allantoate deiminase
VATTNDIKQRAEEVVARCRKIAACSETPGSTLRTFLSPPMHDVHREIAAWMSTAGATVHVDAAGNLRGVFPAGANHASYTSRPRLLLGSHLDSVPNAGAYDGVLGVIIAVALLEQLDGEQFPFAIEVVGFSEEEGVRFGAPFIGSRALVGTLDDELLGTKDANGISVRAAIENFGLNPSDIPRAALSDDVLGYIEFHIEQGPVLESLNRPLAAVEAIVGQTRVELVFRGHANHAGTTPMNLRHDALAAAAEWIIAVEHAAQNDPDLVATVGRIEAIPGAVNVIAGEVRVNLDLRHRSDNARERATDNLVQSAHQITARRGLSLQTRTLLNQRAVEMGPYLVEQIEEAIRKAGCQPHRMVSGAGHDAMILAEKVPSAMIFLRTPDGISHDPAEAVEVNDVAKAIECGSHLIKQLARSSHFQERMSRA